MPKIYSPELLDDKITVEYDESYVMARYLLKLEEIFCGMSTGTALIGGNKID